MRRTTLAVVLVFALALLGACQSAPPTRAPAASAAPIAVRLIAINDLHGYLEPNPYHAPGQPDRVAGGVVALAGAVERLRAEQPASILVAAGDLIGASPLSSSLLHDQPTIEALDRMGMALSAVGNHEFDYGRAELDRLAHGGCPAGGCAAGDAPFAGAKYEYLAANVFDAATGKRAFTPYRIEQVGRARIAFVGAVLEGAPSIIIAKNIAGLRFADEAESVNALIPEIVAQGVHAIVLLIHEGGVPKGEVDANTCAGVDGPIFPIMDRLDPEVDVVVSAHTHQAYVCRYKGRLVTQASSYGRLVTRIDLSIDPRSGDVLGANAENELVDPARPSADPAYAAVVASAKARTDVIAMQPIARLGVDQIKHFRDPSGESALGRFVADAQLEAGRAEGVVIACMNPGGVRQNLPAVPRPDRSLTYGDLQAVHPFGNRLIVLELTGAEIAGVFETQLARTAGEGVLSCSRGFAYRYDKHREPGHRLLPGYPTLDGKPLDPGRTYRVLVNNYIAGGGDGLAQLKDKKPLADLGTDLDALSAYLKAHEPATPPDDVRAEGEYEAR